MCHSAPASRFPSLLTLSLGWLVLGTPAFGQGPPQPDGGLHPDWRRIGNGAVDLFLASLATGPIDRIWFSGGGTRLAVKTKSGELFLTEDFETWKRSPDLQPPAEDDILPDGATAPWDARGKVVVASEGSPRLYALGRYVYRSDDGGRHWANLTRFGRESIIGGGMHDLAVSPADPDDVVVATEHGVWRSLDGGLSWTGLNEFLPNLPVERLLSAPADTRGARILVDGLGAMEWAPGEKLAWRPVADTQAEQQQAALLAARARLGAAVTAVAMGREYSYAGARDGRLWVSSDQGLTWRFSRPAGGGPIEALYADPNEPRLAIATAGELAEQDSAPRVLRTFNGGLFWDDVTANLPPGDVHGAAANAASGAIYVATDRGVFLAMTDLFASGEATQWIPMGESLPAAPVTDVMLDPNGNQLYVAVQGYGVYAAPAPHRFWSLQIVNAADFSKRPAAPGSLLTVLGGRLTRAQAGLLDAPVLHASELQSQIQVPFEAEGRSTRLALEASTGRFMLELPLREVSPAVFVDRDGTPLLLDRDSGTLLDALNPARSNTRVEVLATGLGRVKPSWPTGMAAPLKTPPQVIAPVRVFLDGVPVEVTRATLAPGYVGFYVIEVQLPAIVNSGPAELYLEAGGHESNHVRIYLEP